MSCGVHAARMSKPSSSVGGWWAVSEGWSKSTIIGGLLRSSRHGDVGGSRPRRGVGREAVLGLQRGDTGVELCVEQPGLALALVGVLVVFEFAVVDGSVDRALDLVELRLQLCEGVA